MSVGLVSTGPHHRKVLTSEFPNRSNCPQLLEVFFVCCYFALLADDASYFRKVSNAPKNFQHAILFHGDLPLSFHGFAHFGNGR